MTADPTDRPNTADLPVADIGAERAVLACMLHDPTVRPAVKAQLDPADFYRPNHGDIAAVMFDLETYDPPRLATELIRRRINVDILPDLVTYPALPTEAARHAAQIRETAVRRQLRAAGVRLVQRTSNPGDDLTDAVLGHQADIDTALDRLTHTHTGPSPTVEDFLLGSETYDWAIPGLLERGDRVIVTGGEGAGKSHWLRQIAVCAAAGLHPITLDDIPPVNVLLIDLENSRTHLRRTLRPLVDVARHRKHDVAGRLRVESKPQGIDLGQLDDAGWITAKVDAAQPDLIITGPLYRMHTVALDKEEAARQVTVTLDGVCAKSRAALILEAHAPHGMGGQRWWRPAGSSLFLRWPGFGLGLRPDKDGGVKVLQWRGPRDERGWPERMRRGVEGGWPWIEAEPEERWA